MNRRLYLFAIIFTSLIVAIGLFQSVLYFQLGSQMFTLDSFASWFLIIIAISLIGFGLLLQYFHFKNYRFAFVAGIFSIAAALFHDIVLYSMITSGFTGNTILISSSLLVITGIVFAISLIISPAGQRLWLKIAGMAFFIIFIVAGIGLIWLLMEPSTQSQVLNLKISQWSSLIISLVNLLIIKNFFDEMKKLKPTEKNLPFASLDTGLGIIWFAGIMACLTMGVKLDSEKHSRLDWIEKQPYRAARLARPFEARTFTNASFDALNYRFLKPLNYDPTKTYPMVVCLHGGGGRGTDNVLQIDGSWMAQLLTEGTNREQYPSFIFVPQCAPDETWGGIAIPGTSITDDIVFEAIEALQKEFLIDKSRIYVMGESLGGYGSWHFITERPDIFAAAVPICGGGDPGQAAKIADIPIWAFHGAKDRSVPVSNSRNMIQAIEEAGGSPKYTEFPDEGHIINGRIDNNIPELLDWVFAQQKN